MAGQAAIAPHGHATVEAEAADLAGSEVEDDSPIVVVAGEEVSRLGMGVNKVDHHDHVAHVVTRVQPGEWAASHGIKVDYELLTVNGTPAEEFLKGQGVGEAFKVRPLRLTFKLLSKKTRLSQAQLKPPPQPAADAAGTASDGAAQGQLRQAAETPGHQQHGGGGAEDEQEEEEDGGWAQLRGQFLAKAGKIARLVEDVHAMNPAVLREEIEAQDRMEQAVCALTERFRGVDLVGLRKVLAEREERKAWQWEVLEEQSMLREEGESAISPVRFHENPGYVAGLREEVTEQETAASRQALAALEQRSAQHVARLAEEEVAASRQWLAANEEQNASHIARLREEVAASEQEGLAAEQKARRALHAARQGEEEALAANEERAVQVAQLSEEAAPRLERLHAELIEQEQREVKVELAEARIHTEVTDQEKRCALQAEAALKDRAALEVSLAASQELQEELESLRAELGEEQSVLQAEAALRDRAALEVSLAASQDARRELQEEVESLRAALEEPQQEARPGRLPAELEEEAQVKAALAEVQTIAEFSQRFRRIDLELLREELAHQASLEHLVDEVNAAKLKLEHQQLETSIDEAGMSSEGLAELQDCVLQAREDADRVHEENDALRQALDGEAEEFAMMRQLDCCYGLEEALVIELRNRVRQARDEVGVSTEIAAQERALASRFQEELEEVEAAAIETADVAEASVDALQQEVHGLEHALRRERGARSREEQRQQAPHPGQSEQWPGEAEAPPARRILDDSVALQGQGAAGGAPLGSRGGVAGSEAVRGASPSALPSAGAVSVPARRVEDLPALPAAAADEALTATARAEAQKLRREAELLRREVQDWRTTHAVSTPASRQPLGLPAAAAAPSALGGTGSASSPLDPLLLPSALVQPPPLPPPALPSEQ